MLAIVSEDKAYVVSGTGDVIEPEDGIVAIGSGGMYALAAAKMLKKFSNLSAKEIVEESLKTAADICIYTNEKITVEVIVK
jgi:ATP-dependent HslUV protease subunit HslV